MSRGIEAEILPTVRELGISVTAYGILSRGLLNRDTARLAEGDPRGRFPRFQGGNLERNLELLDALEKIAEQRGVSTAQLAIAWVASRGDDIIPLIGTKRRDRLAEALAALGLRLTPEELAAIEAAVPGRAGGRRPGTTPPRWVPWTASAKAGRRSARPARRPRAAARGRPTPFPNGLPGLLRPGRRGTRGAGHGERGARR